MPSLPYISPDLIKSYQDQIAKSASPATVKRKSISLNRFFDWAKSEGHIDANPFDQTGSRPFVTNNKNKGKIRAGTWAVVSLTVGLVILTFLLTWKLKFPIPFINNFAQGVGNQTAQNVQNIPQNPNQIPANSATIAAWNLYAKMQLTDTNGVPQVGTRTISFKLYNQPTGGDALYTSPSQTVTTDSNGSVLISLDQVPSSLFFQNNTLYLEPEITSTQSGSSPVSLRIPVSTANTPANLGGYFPANPDTGAAAGTVPVIDSTGALELASQSPAIKAKEGNLLVEGQTVTIKSAAGGRGNIEISPDGNAYAHFLFQGNRSNFLNAQAPNLTTGSLYYGMVPNNATGYDLVKLQSGAPTMTTRFTIDALGNVYASGNIILNGQLELGRFSSLPGAVGQGSLVFNSSDKKIYFWDGTNWIPLGSSSFTDTDTLDSVTGRGATTAHAITVGNLTSTGTTTFGGITYTWPGTQFSNYILSTDGSGTLSWVDPSIIAGGTNYWDLASGVLFPKNNTADLLIGGSATTSAKFAFAGVNSGTPTASISGSTAGVATYLTGDGNLATTNGAGLTLGGGTTGNITLNPSNAVAGGNVSPGVTGVTDLGTPSLLWRNIYGTALYQGIYQVCDSSGSIAGCAGGSGTNYWALGAGTIFPVDLTRDLLIGASATASAKFAFMNVLTGTPTASISGSTAGAATFIDGNGNISSTNRNNLVLGNSSTYSTTGNILLNPNQTGNIGIGTANPRWMLHLVQTDASGTVDNYRAADFVLARTVGDSGGQKNSVDLNANYQYSGTGTTYAPKAIQATVDNLSTGTIFESSGVFAKSANDSTGTINFARGLYAQVAEAGTGTIDNAQGVFIGSGWNHAGGTITNNYGLYIENQESGINNYAIYSAGSKSFFAGAIGIGIATPSATLDVAGNASVSGTLSLASGSGTIQTTAFSPLIIGGNTTGNITLNPSNAITGGNISPAVTNVTDLGTPSLLYRNIYGTALYQGIYQVCDSSGFIAGCGSGSGINYWALGSGTLYPINTTQDLLIGASATASAKFAFINVLEGTPTASISGSTAGVATYLTGDGNLATTNGAGLTLGGGTTGNITLNPSNAVAGGNVSPGVTGVTDLGTPSLLWRNIYGTTLYQGTYQVCDSSGSIAGCSSGSGTNYWGQTSGAIYPLNNSVDLLLGANSTSSAKFAFTGVNSGTPTASISGSTAGAATFIDGNGNISSTNGNNLTLGNSTTYNTTGNILLNPNGTGNVGVGSTAPKSQIDINTPLSAAAAAFSPYFRVNSGAELGSSINSWQDLGTFFTRASDYDFGMSVLAYRTSPGTTYSSAGIMLGFDVQNSYLTGGFINLNANGNVGIGTTAPPTALLDVAGDASLSGTLAFRTGTGTIQTTAVSPLVLGGSTTGNILLSPSNDIAGGYVGPNVTNVTDLGTPSVEFRNIYGQALFQNGIAVCDANGNHCPAGSVNYWDQALGAIYPQNNSVDLLVGGDSTVSAKFAFTGVNGGTPTVSIAGTAVGVATFIDGNGNISTTNGQDLILGNSSTYSTTGNILLNPNGTGNVGIGTTSPDHPLDVVGQIRSSDYAYLGGNDTTGLRISGSDYSNSIWQASGPLTINTNGGDLSLGYGNSVEALTVLGTNGNVGIGTGSPTALLDVAGNASVSGTLAFEAGTGTIQTTTFSPLIIGGNTTGNILLSPSNDITGGYIGPNVTNVTDLGTPSVEFRNIYGQALFQNGIAVCDANGNHCPAGSVNYWDEALGTIYPQSNSVDLLLGGTSTSSAKFAFENVLKGTPTASISGSTAGVATFIDGNGNISSTNRNNLIIGNSSTYNSTGNILLNPNGSGNVGIGTVSPAYPLDITTTTSPRAVNIDNTQTGSSDIYGVHANANLTDGSLTGKTYGGYFNATSNGGSSTYGLYANATAVGATYTGLYGVYGNADDGSGNGTGVYGYGAALGGDFESTSTGVNVSAAGNPETYGATIASYGVAAGQGINLYTEKSGIDQGMNTYGIINSVNNYGAVAGGTDNTYGSYINVSRTGATGGIINTYGERINLSSLDDAGAGNHTAYGLYLDNVAGADTNYSIYSTGGTSYFAGNVGIGTTSPTVALDVAGNASVSGTLAFRTGTGTIQTTNFSPLVIGGSTTGNILLSPSNDATGGFVAPNVTNVTDLGTSSLLFRNIYGTTFYQGTYHVCDASGSIAGCGGTNYWGQTSGAIYPLNNSVDLLLGANSTSSAKFAFTGVNSGTPTASISGSTAGVATFIDGNGNFSTTNRNNLTIGNSSLNDYTGNILLNPLGTGNVGIGTTSPTAALDVAGNASVSGTLAFRTGTGTIQTTDLSPLIIGGNTTGNITLNPSNSITGGNISPAVTGATDLGTSSLLFRNIYGTTLYQGTYHVCDASGSISGCGGTNYWGQTAGVIYPFNNTVDLLLGANSTSSAKFAFTGVNSGTPTASISGTAPIATYLTGNGNLATTNFAPITIGGATSGNITLNPSNGTGSITFTGYGTGIIHSTSGVLSSSAINLASGDVTGLLPLANGGTNADLSGVSTGGLIYKGASALAGTSALSGLLYGNGSSGPATVTGLTANYLPKYSSSPYLANSLIYDTGTQVGISTITPTALLDINGNASVSGTLAFRTGTGTIQTTNFSHLVIGGSTTGNITISASNDIAAGFVAPNVTNVTDLGLSNKLWRNIYGTTLYQGVNQVCDASGSVSGCAGNYWAQNNGALFPINNTVDVLFGATAGSTATSSAKFAFTGINGGTPTASISGATNVAIFIDGNGNISSTNRNNLTLGNSSTYNTTGNILINPNGTGNVAIGTTSPTALLDVAGNASISGTLAFRTGTGTIQTTNFSNLVIGGSTTGNITLSPSNNITASYVVPGSNGNTDLGLSGTAWRNVYGTTLYQGVNQVCDASGSVSGCAGNYWAQNNGALFPINNTVDVLFGTTDGATATSSAKFAFTGVNSGIPTASISGSTAGVATFIDGNGNISSTNDNNLTLGNSSTYATTGNILLNPNTNRYVGIGTTDPSVALQIGSGTATHTLGAGSALITNNLELDSTLYLDGGQIANSAGTASIILSSTPTTAASTLSASNWELDNTANLGQAALIVNQLKGGDIFTASASGVPMFVISHAGNVGIGTTNPQALLDIANSTSTISNTSGDITLSATSGNISLNSDTLTNLLRVTAASGTAAAPTYSFSSDTNTGMYDGGSHVLGFATGGTARLTIDSSGNVGIGTTSPTAFLDIAGNASSSGTLTFRTSPTINVENGNNLTFQTSPGGDAGLAARMTLTNAGNVGIGTTSPASIFDVLTTSTSDPRGITSDQISSDTNGAQINLRKARGSVGSLSTLASADVLGNLQYRGYDGTSYIASAAIKAIVNGTVSTGILPTDLQFFTTNTGGTTAEAMRIAGSGDVGIGTTSPTTLLGVAGTASISGVLTVGNGTTNAIQPAFGPLTLNYKSGDNTWSAGVTLSNSDNLNIAGTVNMPGITTTISQISRDLCQNGTEVVARTGTSNCAASSSMRYKQDILSLGSESGLAEVMQLRPVSFYYTPEFLGGFKDDPNFNSEKVGFIAEEMARVDPRVVNFDNQGRPDSISYENITAILAKAVQEQQGEITSMSGQFTNLALTATGDLNISQDNSGNYQLTNTANNSIINQIGAFANVVAANIKSGAITTTDFATQNLNSAVAFVDKLTSNNLAVKLISPVPGDTNVTVQVGTATQPGQFVIQNASGSAVATIDNTGNATFSGQLAASGATISGTLYAGNIKSQSLDDIKSLLTQVQTDQNLLSQAANWNINTATNSANLNSLAVSGLYVTNQAAVNSLSVTNSLTVGTDLVISPTDNSLNTLSAPLKIQSLAMAPVEIMDGLVTIDAKGNVNIAGDLFVAGRIKSSGLTLQDNQQSATASASLLTLQDINGNVVSSVNASGSAAFNGLSTRGLTIAGADATVAGTIVNGVITTNSTIGQAVIPAGTSEITIKDPKVTDYTLVYVTPTSTTENYVLYVKSKQNGQFTVGFTNPIDVDVNFNWWIVQVSQ